MGCVVIEFRYCSLGGYFEGRDSLYVELRQGAMTARSRWLGSFFFFFSPPRFGSFAAFPPPVISIFLRTTPYVERFPLDFVSGNHNNCQYPD